MANFYALLIGIDYYQPNPYFNSLRGAVRDIDKVAAYLDKSLKIPSEQITRLTSPIPDTNSNADVRAARQEQPPTYQNIVKAFDSITEAANTGDLVYIHYSGHGGRVKTIYSDLKGDGQFDECLVPMDVGDDGYYLRDVEMNTLLKRMTDKSLIVTVIFDSCHSGGATRGDGDVRGARDGQVDTNDRPQNSAVATRDVLLANWRVTTQDSHRNGWLPNRKDYVFLGACRPSELAYEAAFGTGTERNGALTYWMLDTLNTVPTGLTYQALYDRVTGQIQSKFSNQLPMLLGEGDRLVFGSEIKPVQYSLTVVNVIPGQVTLNGGQVQGLSRGARFGLYPVGSDFADKQKRLAVVEIIDLQASTATAKILMAEEGGVTAVIEQIEPGLPAVMESEPVNLKHRVRLFNKEVGEKEEQLPPELADKQAAALDRVRQAMQSNGWVIEVEGDESGHYQVAVGRKGEYEISRLIPIDNLTPALSIDDPESANLVVKRLVHLAKYKSIEALDNPESKLSIEFELLDENKQPFPDRNNIKLKSGTVYLRVKNNDAQPLNIAILDLEATWEISSIPIEGENTVFYELVKDQRLEISMDFSVPEGDEYKNRREKLKLFATKGIANFQWLKLPPLDEELMSRGSKLRAETQKIVSKTSVTRGATVQVNPIDLLFSQIGAGTEEPPQVTRAFRRKPTPNADWITSTIEVGFQ
jgi:Caspase domain